MCFMIFIKKFVLFLLINNFTMSIIYIYTVLFKSKLMYV